MSIMFIELYSTHYQLSSCRRMGARAGATARQSVCKWLFDEVATMLMGHVPQLVIERQRVYWRVPDVLTSQRGVLGEVSAVIVDAQSGDLSILPDLANTLVSQAQTLLTRDAPAAHFSSNAA